MRSLLRLFLRSIVYVIVWSAAKILLKVKVYGLENIPTDGRPMILIANHFSWFDAPILGLYLPFVPAFVVATETLRHGWVRWLVELYDGIPVWRGQVDRDAFRYSLQALEKGLVVGIFPEGGMNPENAERIARGEQILQVRGNASRISAQLARPRTGVALLATQSNAHILPVALLGAERILDNIHNRRRTAITLRIGPVFGPLQLEPGLRGPARRQRLDELADLMMQQIAALMPVENRGPYRTVELAKVEASS